MTKYFQEQLSPVDFFEIAVVQSIQSCYDYFYPQVVFEPVHPRLIILIPTLISVPIFSFLKYPLTPNHSKINETDQWSSG